MLHCNKRSTYESAVFGYAITMLIAIMASTEIIASAADESVLSSRERGAPATTDSIDSSQQAPQGSVLPITDLIQPGQPVSSQESVSDPETQPETRGEVQNRAEADTANAVVRDSSTPSEVTTLPSAEEGKGSTHDAPSRSLGPRDTAGADDGDGALKQVADLERQGKYAEALELYEMTAKKAAAAGNKRLAGQALGGAARVSHLIGKNKEALTYIRQSIAVNQTLKNARDRSLDHALEARILITQSNYAEALTALQEAIKIIPASEASEVPELLELTASCEMRLGRHADASKTWNRLLGLYAKNGNTLKLANVSIRIGEQSVSRSDYRMAKEHFKKAEKAYRGSNLKKELGETLFRLAYLEQVQGDLRSARKIAAEAQGLLTGEENRIDKALPLMAMGMNARHGGKETQALEYLSNSLSCFEKSGDTVMAARVRLTIATLHSECSRLKSALELAGKSLEAFRANSVIGGETAALLLIGDVYYRQGYVQKALEYAREASAVAKKLGDKDLIVQTGVFLAEIHNSLGVTEFTSKLLKDTVEDSKAGLNPRTRAHLRLAIARFRLSRESIDKALQDAAEARKEFSDIEDGRGIADSDHLIGLSYELRGDTQKAFEALQKSLEEHRAVWDRFGEGRDLTALGVHYKNRGDYDKALEHFNEALNLRRGIGDPRGSAADLANIGNTLRLRNQIAEAQSNLEQSLVMYKELNDKKGEADSLTNLGHVEMAKGVQSAGLEKFTAALKIHRAIKDNRGVATDLASMGKIYLARGDLENASSVLEEAARLSKGIRNPRGEITILSELAMLYRVKNNRSGALSLLNQSLELARQSSDTRATSSIHLKMAAVLEDSGNYKKALDILRQSLSSLRQQGDPKGELLALIGIGVIEAKTEDYENALKDLLEAERLRNDLGIPSSQSRELDFHLGEIYEGFTDFDRALEHYHKAIASTQAPGNEPLLGRIYDRVGNIYFSMEQYVRAKDFLEDALRVSNENRNITLQKNQLIRLGDIYSRIGDAETALKYQQRALAITRETHDEHTEARVLTRTGTLNQMLGHPRVALENYRESKDIRARLGDRRGMNENLLQIALVTSTLGDSETAIEDLKQAFQICQSSEDRTMLWKAYFIMGRTLESKKSLGEALESYRKAIAILEAMEADTVEDSDEDEFIFGGKRALFETTLRVLMSLARKDPEGAYDDQALRIVERLNYTDFEKTLAATNVDTFSEVPNDLLIKEKSLRLSLRKLNSRLEEERSKVTPNQAQMSKLLEERKMKEKNLKELKDILLAEYPAYSELRYPHPITLHELQKNALDPDEAVLAYMITRSKTYVFAFDKYRFHTYSIDYPATEIEKDVDAIIRPLLRADMQASWDPSVAYRIYSKLIKPLEYFLVSKKTVVVVPHGPLAALPFEILVDSKAHATRRFWSATDRPSYLVEKYAFCYAPSVSVLAQVRNRSRVKKPGWNLVAFGDPDYGDCQKTNQPNPGAERLISSINVSTVNTRGQELRPLPGARKEVNEIVKIVGGSTQTYLGPLATETLFKKADLARYAYVHLATHVVLLNGLGKLQQRPAIVFSLYGDKENDGFLQLGEVFGLRLNSELVVISSCLAPGKTDQGDYSGLLGLARAFLFAGTDSVILSMWQVNDESTVSLFTEMYRNLRDASKAESLRAAKLALLSNSGTSHPYYWGSFVLIGDWRARLQPSHNSPTQEHVRFRGLSNWRKLLTF